MVSAHPTFTRRHVSLSGTRRHATQGMRTYPPFIACTGDGTLCINEFFRWSLGNASKRHGADALARAFARYDRNGTGALDAMEFSNACHDFGFGSGANDIFKTLDVDGSGTVSYNELVESLTAVVPSDPEAKGMLTALVCSLNDVKGEEAAKRIDTTGWRVRGTHVEALKEDIRLLYRTSGAQVPSAVCTPLSAWMHSSACAVME